MCVWGGGGGWGGGRGRGGGEGRVVTDTNSCSAVWWQFKTKTQTL